MSDKNSVIKLLKRFKITFNRNEGVSVFAIMTILIIMIAMVEVFSFLMGSQEASAPVSTHSFKKFNLLEIAMMFVIQDAHADDDDNDDDGDDDDDDGDDDDSVNNSCADNNCFYYTDDVPNITYVGGDLSVIGNRTVWGIFYVKGDVSINGSAVINGLIICEGDITMNGGGNADNPNLSGGIIHYGSGNLLRGNGSPVYVKVCEDYFDALDSVRTSIKIKSWQETVSSD